MVSNNNADLNESSNIRTIRNYNGNECQIQPKVIKETVVPPLENAESLEVDSSHMKLMSNITDCKSAHKSDGCCGRKHHGCCGRHGCGHHGHCGGHGGCGHGSCGHGGCGHGGCGHGGCGHGGCGHNPCGHGYGHSHGHGCCTPSGTNPSHPGPKHCSQCCRKSMGVGSFQNRNNSHCPRKDRIGRVSRARRINRMRKISRQRNTK